VNFLSHFSQKSKTVLLAIAAVVLMAANSHAQRARFSDFFSNTNTNPLQGPQGTLPGLPGNFQPPAILQPPTFQGLPAGTIPGGPLQGVIPQGGVIQGGIIPGGVLQPPTFNQPIGSGVPSIQMPQLPQPNASQAPNQPFPIFPRGQQPAASTAPSLQLPTFPQNQPQFQPQSIPNNGPIFGRGQPNYNGGIQYPQLPAFGGYGSPQAPNRWPYQGTGTNWLPSVDWTWPQQAWQTFRTQFLPRVLERPRARQTYLQGSNGNELNINDLEIATTATLPNFLQGNQPLRISPGFIFHWWDGPDSNVYPQFDLPARAYSTYLAFDHITNPANQSGFETNLTVGYYSDFQNTSSDAIRLTGKVLGWQRLNPYTVGKLGIEYFDRVDVKMLPAVGVYMTPNPDMKLDLYFPRPKLSHRIPNFGDLEAWMYVGGEYGGGSWAIDRRDGTGDQVDINDVRAFVGMEWMGPRRVTGFFEFGYAFDREIVYRSNAMNILDLQDTLMVRSGLAF
jgi:hypothetical protein